MQQFVCCLLLSLHLILTGELICAGTGTRLWLRTQKGVGEISYFKGYELSLGLESKHLSKKFVLWRFYRSYGLMIFVVLHSKIECSAPVSSHYHVREHEQSLRLFLVGYVVVSVYY